MPFTRWGFKFDGPHRLPDSLEGRAGVYVVWCNQGTEWGVLDVGESWDVRRRLADHDRLGCWARHRGSGTIYYSATYTPDAQQADRVRIEHDIRDVTNPPCGER